MITRRLLILVGSCFYSPYKKTEKQIIEKNKYIEILRSKIHSVIISFLNSKLDMNTRDIIETRIMCIIEEMKKQYETEKLEIMEEFLIKFEFLEGNELKEATAFILMENNKIIAIYGNLLPIILNEGRETVNIKVRTK